MDALLQGFAGRPWFVPYQPLVTVTVAVAAGIVFDRYGPHETAVPALWLLGVCCLVAWWQLWRRRHDGLALWPLLTAAALAAAAWHHANWQLFDRHEIGRFAPREMGPACIEAVARASPERVPAPRPTPLRAIPGTERSRLRIAVSQVRDGVAWQPASGECELLVEGHLLGVHPGDRLRIFGQLARTRPPLNPGEFNFAERARADRHLAVMRSSAPDSVTLVSSAGYLAPSEFVDSLRVAAKRQVRRFVGPDRAGLAAAILLGAREGLSAEETEPYFLTGTIHVLVVSGLNVAILAAGLYWLMRIGWVPRRVGLAVIIGVVAVYAVLAEGQPPVMRAAVFAVLICVAAWTGRVGAAFNSLAAAALVVLIINPNDLFRSGPQLSFLAVGVLVWMANWYASRSSESVDRLDQLLAAARPWYARAVAWAGRWTGWLLLTSLAVWLVTLPLLLFRFHIASPVSVAISPVIWLVVFVAMWSGFLMLVVGWLIPAVGTWLGALCSASLTALERSVEWAEAVPGGHFWAPGPAWWWVLVFYLALLAVMIRGRELVPPRWQLAALCVWILVGVTPALARSVTRDGFDCSFIAVGHGTSIVLQSPTGETLLYDAGALGSPEFATQTIGSYLWHRGIMRLDAIVISHADVDHYNAVPGLLERFQVGAVYVSPMMFDGFDDPGANGGPVVLREAIASAGVPLREIWSGDQLRVGPEVTARVIHPPRDGVLGSDNANSIVLAVEFDGCRVLLPGDLESPGLDDVVAELPYDCDVLLAPHHGSRRSDPPGFAAWSTPEWVVISGGASAEVQPVVETYRRAGAKVLQTSERGTVNLVIHRGSLQMATWLTQQGAGSWESGDSD